MYMENNIYRAAKLLLEGRLDTELNRMNKIRNHNRYVSSTVSMGEKRRETEIQPRRKDIGEHIILKTPHRWRVNFWREWKRAMRA